MWFYFNRKATYSLISILEEDDLQQLIPIVTEFIPNEKEDLENLLCLFKVTAAALKSRDEDLNEAIEALDNKEADKEIKNENKKLKKEIKELKKETKEIDKKLKKLQTAKVIILYFKNSKKSVLL